MNGLRGRERAYPGKNWMVCNSGLEDGPAWSSSTSSGPALSLSSSSLGSAACSPSSCSLGPAALSSRSLSLSLISRVAACYTYTQQKHKTRLKTFTSPTNQQWLNKCADHHRQGFVMRKCVMLQISFERAIISQT